MISWIEHKLTYLDGLLHVLGVVLVDVVVRADRLLQLVVHHLPGSLEMCGNT